jgi:hypothetical protein
MRAAHLLRVEVRQLHRRQLRRRRQLEGQLGELEEGREGALLLELGRVEGGEVAQLTLQLLHLLRWGICNRSSSCEQQQKRRQRQ